MGGVPSESGAARKAPGTGCHGTGAGDSESGSRRARPSLVPQVCLVHPSPNGVGHPSPGLNAWARCRQVVQDRDLVMATRSRRAFKFLGGNELGGIQVEAELDLRDCGDSAVTPGPGARRALRRTRNTNSRHGTAVIPSDFPSNFPVADSTPSRTRVVLQQHVSCELMGSRALYQLGLPPEMDDSFDAASVLH